MNCLSDCWAVDAAKTLAGLDFDRPGVQVVDERSRELFGIIKRRLRWSALVESTWGTVVHQAQGVVRGDISGTQMRSGQAGHA